MREHQHQRASFDADVKRLSAHTSENIVDAVVDLGLATRAEVDDASTTSTPSPQTR